MRYLSCLFVILVACNSSDTKDSAESRFDKLENIFSTANWRVTGGMDTSYLYFSRIGSTDYTVFDYKILNGDSSMRELSNIKPAKDGIYWLRKEDTLRLESADSNTAIWESLRKKKDSFVFRKYSDDSISAIIPGGQNLQLSKTLPMSLFLVRSKYDYLHNTHTVDSPIVRPRGIPGQ